MNGKDFTRSGLFLTYSRAPICLLPMLEKGQLLKRYRLCTAHVVLPVWSSEHGEETEISPLILRSVKVPLRTTMFAMTSVCRGGRASKASQTLRWLRRFLSLLALKVPEAFELTD